MFQSQNSYLRTIVVPPRYPTLAAITGIFNDLNILTLQLGLKETAMPFRIRSYRRKCTKPLDDLFGSRRIPAEVIANRNMIAS